MSDFPDHKNNTPENNTNSIFNIGGIKIPQGNTLAIWFLVVTVIFISFLGYGFWLVIDRVLDNKLGPDVPNNQTVMQDDYNRLLKSKESIDQVNILLIDSLKNYKKDVTKTTDSVIYELTEPYIKQTRKNP